VKQTFSLKIFNFTYVNKPLISEKLANFLSRKTGKIG
jgi:hypothetical protein